MVVARPILAQQLVLVLTIALAIAVALAYLRRRQRLYSLRELWLPLALFALFGTLDALVTMRGTWNAPLQENNPLTRAFLLRAGWVGECIAAAIWILGWVFILGALESLRLRLAGAGAAFVGWARLWVAYALAMGHLNGFTSWGLFYGSSVGSVPGGDAVAHVFFAFLAWLYQRAPVLFAVSPFGYTLYGGLAFGGLCAALHAGSVATYRRIHQPPLSAAAQGRRA